MCGVVEENDNFLSELLVNIIVIQTEDHTMFIQQCGSLIGCDNRVVYG